MKHSQPGYEFLRRNQSFAPLSTTGDWHVIVQFDNVDSRARTRPRKPLPRKLAAIAALNALNMSSVRSCASTTDLPQGTHGDIGSQGHALPFQRT